MYGHYHGPRKRKAPRQGGVQNKKTKTNPLGDESKLNSVGSVGEVARALVLGNKDLMGMILQNAPLDDRNNTRIALLGTLSGTQRITLALTQNSESSMKGYINFLRTKPSIPHDLMELGALKYLFERIFTTAEALPAKNQYDTALRTIGKMFTQAIEKNVKNDQRAQNAENRLNALYQNAARDHLPSNLPLIYSLLVAKVIRQPTLQDTYDILGSKAANKGYTNIIRLLVQEVKMNSEVEGAFIKETLTAAITTGQVGTAKFLLSPPGPILKHITNIMVVWGRY
jgi:hypothetical protein